jgi:hypothetical protein
MFFWFFLLIISQKRINANPIIYKKSDYGKHPGRNQVQTRIFPEFSLKLPPLFPNASSPNDQITEDTKTFL